VSYKNKNTSYKRYPIPMKD